MYCVVDLGSTKTEITLFSDSLRPLGASGFETPFKRDAGVVSIDPEHCMAEIERCFRAALSSREVSPRLRDDFHCSVTGMGSTISAVDREGRVLVPAISWEFRVPGGKILDYPVSRTGKLLLPTYPLYKIAWMKERISLADPLFLALPDYVLAALSGFRGFFTDYSFASRSLLFDDASCDWDDEILGAVGLRRANLPLLREAGAFIGDFDPGLKARLGLGGEARLYAGMHDHAATSYTGSLLSDGRDTIVNPAGTTESAAVWSGDPERRAGLVREAPGLGINTESAWRRDILALVTYTTLSGKILENARDFGVEPSPSWRGLPQGLIVAPSRRRLVVEDRGLVADIGSGGATLDDFWRAIITATQFEFRSACEDLEKLTGKPAGGGVQLFGGQAGNANLCRLKSAVRGLPVFAFPVVNGAALGVAARISGLKPDIRDLRRDYFPADEERLFFDRQYRRYREICDAARMKELL